MTLQTRVAVLEKDVASLRSRTDNADVERDDINRQLADLRAEMRGWAQIAVRTDQKMDAAAELMQLIHADVSQAKDTLAEHGGLLREHGGLLREQGSLLREILARLDSPRS
jgi:chromosome segregation ATPase